MQELNFGRRIRGTDGPQRTKNWELELEIAKTPDLRKTKFEN